MHIIPSLQNELKCKPVKMGKSSTTVEFKKEEPQEIEHLTGTNPPKFNSYPVPDGKTILFIGGNKVLLDGFSATYPVKEKDAQGAIIEHIQGLKGEIHSVKVPSSSYSWSYHYHLSSGAKVLLQAAPYAKSKNFIRLELNPSRFKEDDWETLRESILVGLFLHGTPEPRVTKIHATVDMRGVEANTVLLFSSRFKRTCTFFSPSGGIETQYSGSPTSDLQLVLYDKSKEAGLPYPVTRAEVRYEPSKGTTFAELGEMQLFEKVKLYKAPCPVGITPHDFAGFIAFSQLYGLSAARATYKKPVFQKHLTALEQAFSLWKPEILQSHFKKELEFFESRITILPL